MFKKALYDRNAYPLKTFYYHTMPLKMVEALKHLQAHFDVVIRGGLAYVIASEDRLYPLRDIDLALEMKQKEALLLEATSLCDEVYLNKNTFGDDVVTLFWAFGEEYYKLDILLVETLPTGRPVFIEIFQAEFKIMDLTDIFYNRICKIAEKDLRNYTDEKVMRHFQVVSKLNQYFIDNGKMNKEAVKKIGLKNWSEKMTESLEIMSAYLLSMQLEQYRTDLIKIVKMLKDE